MYQLFIISAATKSQTCADKLNEILDGKPLITKLHKMLEGIESWSKDLDDMLLEVNQAKVCYLSVLIT